MSVLNAWKQNIDKERINLSAVLYELSWVVEDQESLKRILDLIK
ncbi:MAG: hypothetical protein R2941_08050 [Desulfobacterales bacterium]